jgi:hypothetical protein
MELPRSEISCPNPLNRFDFDPIAANEIDAQLLSFGDRRISLE